MLNFIYTVLVQLWDYKINFTLEKTTTTTKNRFKILINIHKCSLVKLISDNFN